MKYYVLASQKQNDAEVIEDRFGVFWHFTPEPICCTKCGTADHFGWKRIGEPDIFCDDCVEERG